MVSLRRLCLFAVLILGCPPLATAQTALSGIVRDPHGQVMVDVVVTAEHEITGYRWETITTGIGLFVFERLPPGPFRVGVEVPPFEPVVTRVTIRARLQTGHDIDLRFKIDDNIKVGSQKLARLASAEGLVGRTFLRSTIEAPSLASGRTHRPRRAAGFMEESCLVCAAACPRSLSRSS